MQEFFRDIAAGGGETSLDKLNATAPKARGCNEYDKEKVATSLDKAKKCCGRLPPRGKWHLV